MVGMEKSRCFTEPHRSRFHQNEEANKNIRKEQRREAARRRDLQIESIMAAENDPKTFFRLVRNQRKPPANGPINSSSKEIPAKPAKRYVKPGPHISRNLPSPWRMRTLIMNTNYSLTWTLKVSQQSVRLRVKI